MISVRDIVTPRFQLAVLAAILFQGLQSVAMPTIISAAEQEMPRRHSLIHRSAGESAALPVTVQGTMLQPPSAEPTRITSPIEQPKTSVSQPTMPMHHRTLAKRPAIASITAPATSSQTPGAALTSGVSAGQVTQTTADPTKGTTLSVPAPIMKSMAAPLPGMTSTGSAAVVPTAPSPFAGAPGVRSAASAGSGSVPSSSGSRSALNLLQNSAIARLLQPPTTVVISPPSLPPPSTPPPAPPPPSPSTGTVTLTWTANREPDLTGYKVYVGTASGTYSFPGSAFVIGKVTSYTVSNLPMGQTYFFAISAYDSAGNESLLSAEVSKSLF
jgi:fibronectin type III domain protein